MNEYINDIEVNTSGPLLNDSSCNQNDFYANSCMVDLRRKGKKTKTFLISAKNFQAYSNYTFIFLQYTDHHSSIINCTAMQLVIFLIFVLGIFFAILIYCKSCSRTSARYSQNSSDESDRNQRGESENINSLPYYTLHESRDWPPSYSEACSAPPLYTAPFNRVLFIFPSIIKFRINTKNKKSIPLLILSVYLLSDLAVKTSV
ncbi:uncharacterized protein LOC117610538 isoform X2 [Osmia lignaria lignaria]|uniref:uncharacterized protein LOC117610538 isoform X2 n=1 Tax=Osmia lignaria lignaria TaxID=1437193 RepID=UPI00402B17F9